MRYLFFDIECSDGNHICSFGYVITDEKFNLVSQKDIIINPQARFCLSAHDEKPTIELAYSEAAFRKAPLFYECYDTIKELLEYPDQLVVGHSVDNDARFLRTACDRYDLPCINFKFADSQIMFAEYANYKNNISLENMGSELSLKKLSFTHRSDLDSEITMRAVKEMCKGMEIDLSDFISLCPYCTGKMENFEITLDRPPKAELVLSDELIAENGNAVKGKNIRLFYKYVEIAKPEEGKFKNVLGGRKYTLNMNFERSHFRESVVLIQLILNNGGKYVAKATSADFYLAYGDGKQGRCPRYEYVKEAARKGRKIEIITLNKFLERLGVKEEELKTLPLPSLNLNEKPKWKSKRELQEENTYLSDGKTPTLGDLYPDLMKKKK